MKNITLAELELNELAEIESVSDLSLAARLLPLGCAPGEQISIERRALFGDPIIIRSGGGLLSMRKADAIGIIVKKKL